MGDRRTDGRTDRWTNWPTDRPSYRDAWTHLKRFRNVTLWNRKDIAKGICIFLTRDISKNLSKSVCRKITIFRHFFAAFRIKLVNPLGDAISIFIYSMSLKFGAYLVIPVLYRQVAIDFCSSSPSIMGPSVHSISVFEKKMRNRPIDRLLDWRTDKSSYRDTWTHPKDYQGKE